MIRNSKTKKMFIEIEDEGLGAAQKRIIKSINNLMVHLSTTEDESEFFEASAEIMRLTAGLIQQSNFSEELKDSNNIPYAEQALEYSMDVLNDFMVNSKVVRYDN